jgi:hypothetical protein
VADRADGLARLEETVDECNRVLVHPELVRVADAARQDERVVVVGIRVGHDLVDRMRGARLQLLLVQRRDLAVVERDELELRAGLLQGLPRLLQLALLVRVGRQEGDLLAL